MAQCGGLLHAQAKPVETIADLVYFRAICSQILLLKTTFGNRIRGSWPHAQRRNCAAERGECGQATEEDIR
jgi:hypothetical protein